jgi:hypothetical protein
MTGARPPPAHLASFESQLRPTSPVKMIRWPSQFRHPPWHPFYTCPHDLYAARNIWVLPGAPEWWHKVLWGLGLERSWDDEEYEDPADSKQGDLRWRLFRAAGELRDKAGCSLVLVPHPRTEPPPDFANRNIFLTKYLRIRGTISLDTFARCHFTQELYRMTWGWEPRLRPRGGTGQREPHGASRQLGDA